MRFSLNRFCFLLLLVLTATVARSAPADTGRTIVVQIISAKNSYGTQTDSGLMQRMIENVQLRQGETFMSCDSAYLNLSTNNMEAFGNVRISQVGGTQISSDYLRYYGNKKLAYLKGNVSLTDGKNNLWSEDLSYDVNSKVATYNDGGTLQSDATTLSSNTGIYNTKSKDARFKGEVYVSDPDYEIMSEDLGYNTGSKVLSFFAPSVVTNAQSELRTSSGYYDTKSQQAHFRNRSSIRNEAQYIEADTIDYNRKTGYGRASGKVYVLDTQQQVKLWCGLARYNEQTKTLFATKNPVLRKQQEKDSLFIAADTFYSAPESRIQAIATQGDSLSVKAKKQKKALVDTIATATVDTSAPRFYVGFHHVKVWSDSLQAICDSISYSVKDSVLKMMGKPVAWSRESQITGDTILLYTDSTQLRKLFVPANAFVVSRTGPPKAKLFDQVQGKTLTAYFEKGKIDHMIVFPAAETIYFPKDDNGAYLGVSQAEGERMKIFFVDGNIGRIIFEQEIKQTMTPIPQANLPAMRLSRFQWLESKRPASKAELFK